MGSQDSCWSVPVTNLVIMVSAVLVLSCGETDRRTDADERITSATLEPACVKMSDPLFDQIACTSQHCLRDVTNLSLVVLLTNYRVFHKE